jgi:23S rRNA (pseudouridine1915-N3)-methyltransferase
LKVEVYYIGKPRSRPLNDAAAEYAKRLGRYCRFSIREIKSEKDAPETKALRVALDPRGETLDSAELAALLEGAQRDVAFYIGGADGWTDEFRRGADRLLSLSKMTLPHELARVVLVEQIYRAFTILSGHPYNRA